jgi:hypothetical protein
MALYLVERLTDEATALMVQLGIESKPRPGDRLRQINAQAR